ncbi:hypothetical protein [Flavobacterium granuli]|uniref:Uncharacterized protein n=1 Tax=Flavobacterium granuli TaxID=280093 RepID=A0ABU1S0D8_9FLAO|nr:hypothetical protein [Flavobacterium granuli]MDR6844483.1 hypothetical protein [Flavobacterium granuli]
MEKLEIFLEKRMRQSEHHAMMIRRYNEFPDQFLGSKNYTEQDSIDAQNDSVKCKLALKLLKELKKAKPGTKEITIIIT